MLDRRFRSACFAMLVLSVALVCPAVAGDDSFTISGVHEDVTAANALAAKDQAQAEGQAKAFDTLMGRIAAGKAPHLDSAQITDLVAGFEVANERTSTVRYVADYTFHFNPSAIRRLLEASSVAYVEPPAAAKAVVVLPVLTGPDRSELWDDPNPWRDAWANQGGAQDALPIVVPAGDLPDIAAIDAPKALAGDRAAIKAISARYQNDDVLVVRGKMVPGEPPRFTIDATRYAPDNAAAPKTATLTVTEKPGETQADFMARAATYTISELGRSWKAASTVDPNTGGTLDATVASGSLDDWVAVRNRLRAVPTMRGADVESIDRGQIHIAIRYIGGQDQFRAALGDRGLDLTGGDPAWTLTLRASPSAAAPAAKPDGDGAAAAAPKGDQ